MKDNEHKSLRRKIKGKGLGPLLRQAISVLKSKVYLHLKLYVIIHDLGGQIPEFNPPQGYILKELSRDEMDMLLPLVSGSRVRKYRNRIDQGMHCFAMMRNGTVTNFLWCSTSDVVDDILGIRIPVGGGEAYSFDTVTRPEFRHRGLFFCLLIYHLHVLKSMGMLRGIAVHNAQDMLKVYPRYKKAGIPVQIIKVIRFRRLLLWTNEHWETFDGHLVLK
ncbi:MAG: hypothetical protein ACE5OP_00490 [Candidatus Glassbacteria bacterium]